MYREIEVLHHYALKNRHMGHYVLTNDNGHCVSIMVWKIELLAAAYTSV